MPAFSYRAARVDGTTLEGLTEADNEQTARAQLERQGFLVFRIQRRGGRPAFLDAGLYVRRTVPLHEFLVFNQEFLALIKAGLPILSALDLVMARQTHPRLRQILEKLREAVKGGASLSDAAEQHPNVFSPLYVASLRVGEKSGELPEALARYIAHLKRVIALQKKLGSALLYPAMLLVLTIAVVIFLLTVVVPSFSQIYLDFEAQLPYATRLLLSFTSLIREYLLITLPLPLLGLLGLWQWRRTKGGRLSLDRLFLRLPLLGSIIQRFSLATFCRTLGTVSAGGMPMVPALEVAAGSVHNRAAQAALHRAIPAVTAGASVAAALEQVKAAPPLVLEMVSVGERTGGLEEMLHHVADFLEEELEYHLSALATALGPAVMVTMGLFVAAIVITMYLPIFHLASVVR